MVCRIELSAFTSGSSPSTEAQYSRILAWYSPVWDSRAACNRSSQFSKKCMLRYHLDDLGPYQFDKLTQSALKSAPFPSRVH
jgi:hypothetical protein